MSILQYVRYTAVRDSPGTRKYVYHNISKNQYIQYIQYAQ